MTAVNLNPSRVADAERLGQPEPFSGASNEGWLSGKPLLITVVFTGMATTIAALKHARHLAEGLSAEIRIVMPQVVPHVLPLEQPPVSPEFRVRYFCTAAGEHATGISIEVHLCRDAHLAVVNALRPGSLVLIGRRGPWWVTGEKSLARTLRRAGHQVLIVDHK